MQVAFAPIGYDEDQIARNIQHAMSLPLPEADIAQERLTVVAGGPSAKDARLRTANRILAVNGGLRTCLGQGIEPDYWAACDPSPEVATFVEHPPCGTVYFVASKCHPSVFDALKDRKVVRWHVSDYCPPNVNAVPTASSITLVAIRLMHRILAYRHFDIYGWDGCYLDGEHHASTQTAPNKANDIPVMVGASLYQSNSTWLAEAQDAIKQLHHADYDVTIHGPGMIAAMLESYRQAAGRNVNT